MIVPNIIDSKLFAEFSSTSIENLKESPHAKVNDKWLYCFQRKKNKFSALQFNSI